MTHFEAQEKSNSEGLATFVFDVEEGADAFLLTAEAEGGRWAFVDTIRSPSGEIVFNALDLAEGSLSLTGAQYANPIATINWPILAEHPPLEPGRWKVQVGPLNEDFFLVQGVEMAGSLSFKQDEDNGAGTLKVRIVYADGTNLDSEIVRGTEAAVAVWTDIYAAHGITLEVTEGIYTGPLTESPTGGSGLAYESIAEDSGIGVLSVVILGDFTDWEIDIYGVSGGIPGPLAVTSRSAVGINGFTSAGPDMVFTNEEIRIMGETLAHEVGHYLGAFHPVEDGWVEWDAISDTLDCTNQNGCVQALGSNLMFPYPVCSVGGICTPQQDLTAGQLAVLNHHVGVR